MADKIIDSGFISALSKHVAIIHSNRVGNVRFPISAAKVSNKKIEEDDMMKYFKMGDIIAFCARKTSTGLYESYCGVKECQLIKVTANITTINTNKYYVNAFINNMGKVFIPFSIKNSDGKPWMAAKSNMGDNVELMVMTQPTSKNNGYKYIGHRLTSNKKVDKRTTCRWAKSARKRGDGCCCVIRMEQQQSTEYRKTRKMSQRKGETVAERLLKSFEALKIAEQHGHTSS